VSELPVGGSRRQDDPIRQGLRAVSELHEEHLASVGFGQIDVTSDDRLLLGHVAVRHDEVHALPYCGLDDALADAVD
jgi:hypothetical protein